MDLNFLAWHLLYKKLSVSAAANKNTFHALFEGCSPLLSVLWYMSYCLHPSGPLVLQDNGSCGVKWWMGHAGSWALICEPPLKQSRTKQNKIDIGFPGLPIWLWYSVRWICMCLLPLECGGQVHTDSPGWWHSGRHGTDDMPLLVSL